MQGRRDVERLPVSMWWMETPEQLAAWDFWGRTETPSLPSGLNGQDWYCAIIAQDGEQTP